MRLVEDYKSFTTTGGFGKKITTLFNPNFHCVCLYRLSNLLYKCHLGFLGKMIWYINRLLFSVDIDYRADLAGGFVLVHGLGTVIGRNVISKGKLVVYQHVTLGGGNGRPGRLDSDGKVRGMPLFEPDCVIYAGAVVVGGITVREKTIIKAGSIVARDII